MPRFRPTALPLLIGGLIAAAPLLAEPFEGFETRGTFGTWRVICDGLDDMGGITWTDCAVADENGLAFLVTGATLRVGLSGPPGVLRMRSAEMDLTGCDAAACETDWAPEGLAEILEGAELAQGGASRAVSTEGLPQAIARARAIVD